MTQPSGPTIETFLARYQDYFDNPCDETAIIPSHLFLEDICRRIKALEQSS